jgi:hypothetical protein
MIAAVSLRLLYVIFQQVLATAGAAAPSDGWRSEPVQVMDPVRSSTTVTRHYGPFADPDASSTRQRPDRVHLVWEPS